MRDVTTEPKQRLGYIDWMRGLACVLMFQTHCYDSWLSPQARESAFFGWSRLVGTLPAPLFLFLAGVSFALVTDKLRRRGVSDAGVMRQTMRRGAEIFGIALLFRLQQFAMGFPWAPWSDLLRVDILNMMGLSMVVMAAVCRVARTTVRSILLAAATAAAIALAAPPMWTTWRAATSQLPWFLESYLNGVHTLGVPQPWLFPIFPWMALAFAGLAAGFILFSDWARTREASTPLLLGAGGAACYYAAAFFDALPVQLCAVYDYWHTSPNFMLARVGILLVILCGCWIWCRWGAGEWGFSPMMQLGQTSLLVYWVHIEFVYGRFSLLPKRGVDVRTATLGLLAIFLMMLVLSIARTRLKRTGKPILARGDSKKVAAA
jgi:uncharacterized membrane protein